MRPPAFSPGQVVGAVSLAGLVQGALVLSVVLARVAGGQSVQREPPLREMRIAVKPMLDAPLLHKGTQAAATPPKLPDMWKPPPPKPPPEPKAVPAPQAKKPPEASDPKPTKPEERPTPETPQARRVDDMVKKMQREAEDPSDPQPPEKASEKGGEDGVKEGTETDPLKARATDSYKLRLQKWFQEGFSEPLDELDCATLVKLRARVRAQIGANREVQSYSMESSGNEIFDGRVRAAMEAHVGQVVPPPPPNYPQLLERVFLPTFVGENEKCK